MGALTESRKRLCFGSISSPFLSLDPDCIVDPQPLKKPRLAAMAPVSPVSGIGFPPQTPENPISRIRSFPPLSPLPRAVHAPQRNLKFFGQSVRNSQATGKDWVEKDDERASTMQGLLMTAKLLSEVRKAKEAAFDFIMGNRTAGNFYSERLMDVESEGLDLEEYKRLVERHSVGSDQVCEPKTSSVSSLTFLKWDAADMVEMVDPQSPGLEVEVRTPCYRELYESSKGRDSKLRLLDLEVRLAQMKVSAFKFLHFGEREKEDADHAPFIPLTEEEEDYVSRALGGSNRRECLVFHKRSNITITGELLRCLRPPAWLNDEVINLYLELLKEREISDPKSFLKCHFFNTFFYKKLTSGRNGYNFKAVRRWTTAKKIGYNLIECDKIFVPIHRDIHWCLAVIDIKAEKFQYLDSLKGKDNNVLKVLARYFMDEVKDKSGNDVNVNTWKQEVVDDLPEQQNGWDCGMFMLKYIDFYSRGLNLCFGQNVPSDYLNCRENFYYCGLLAAGVQDFKPRCVHVAF
ncbi:hypothetical protein ACLOJK_017851 [Asimina triloba]